VFVYIVLYFTLFPMAWINGFKLGSKNNFECYSTDKLQGVCFISAIFRAAGPEVF